MFGQLKHGISCTTGDEVEGKGSSAAEIEEHGQSDDYGGETEEEHNAALARGDSDARIIMPQNATFFTDGPGSGMSLDGRSLLVPMDRDFDEVSSINTAQFGYMNELRILGAVEQDDGDVESRHYQGPPMEQSPQRNDYPKDAYEFHSARPRRDEKTLDTELSYDGGCLPLWITEAPKWLKIVIVLSTALLVGAIALIGVGAAIAVQKNKDGSTFVQRGNPVAPEYPSASPVSMPMDAVGGDAFSTPAPTSDDGETAPVASTPSFPAPTSAPFAPTKAPNAPTLAPVATPGSTPGSTAPQTSAPTSSTVTFYLTGGRFTGQVLAEMPEKLPTLPLLDGNAVMFHLGDWNSPFATSCVENSYQVNVDLFSQSSVPVYFVPGDNEYNDCPNPDEALGFWKKYLTNFETQFWPASQVWNVTRQEPDFAENFAYAYNGVLVVGINLVGGIVHNTSEWQDRHAANLLWIEEQYSLNEGNFEVMVVVAHADPVLQANENFFSTFYERVRTEYSLQVILVHRNLGVQTWSLEPSYNSIENLMVVVVEGNIWPPMLMQVNARAGTVDIDQGQWYEDYISNPNQWNP